MVASQVSVPLFSAIALMPPVGLFGRRQDRTRARTGENAHLDRMRAARDEEATKAISRRRRKFTHQLTERDG